MKNFGNAMPESLSRTGQPFISTSMVFFPTMPTRCSTLFDKGMRIDVAFSRS